MDHDAWVKTLLAQAATKRKSALFRAASPFIAHQTALGVAREDILVVLKRCGLDLTLNTYKSYSQRFRKEITAGVELPSANLTTQIIPPSKAEPAGSDPSISRTVPSGRIFDNVIKKVPPGTYSRSHIPDFIKEAIERNKEKK